LLSPLEFGARRSPTKLAASALLAGLVVLLLSFAVGVAHFRVGTTQSERGYAHAIAWTWGYIVVAPAIIYFFSSSLRAVTGAIEELGRRRMLYAAEGDAPTQALASWRDILVNARKVSWALTVIAFAEAIVEWWVTSGAPLLVGATPAENEIDWSVRFLHGTLLERLANAAFSLLAFLMQGAIVTAVLQLGVFIYCIYIWLDQLGDRAPPVLSTTFPSNLPMCSSSSGASGPVRPRPRRGSAR